MHRSGTTMLSELMQELGLFFGRELNQDAEAGYFVKHNNWLLRQSGASWDNPEPIRHLLANDDVLELVCDYLQTSMRGVTALSFLGWRKFARYRDIRALDIPWGWKDPRTTFTLPVWRRIFPDARVIHIVRHGLDVASSLRARDENVLLHRGARHHKLRPLYAFKFKQIGFVESLRCSSLAEGLQLWLDYVQEAQRQVGDFGDRAIEVRYEDFLFEPAEELQRIAGFLELPVSAAQLDSMSAKVRPDRAYAHRAKPELREVASEFRSLLAEGGYPEDGSCD